MSKKSNNKLRLLRVDKITVSTVVGIATYLFSSSIFYDYLRKQKEVDGNLSSVGAHFLSPILGAVGMVITAKALNLFVPEEKKHDTMLNLKNYENEKANFDSFENKKCESSHSSWKSKIENEKMTQFTSEYQKGRSN